MDISTEAPLYSSFADVVGIIFNNWTAIKLAVEHGMGGPPAVARGKLASLVDTVTQTLASGSVDEYDVSDLLSDAVDAEFSTILEDESNDEVAAHLCRLHEMFRAGDHTSVHAALASLPVRTPIHLFPPATTRVQREDSSGDDDDEDNAAEDDGWTVVKRK